MIRYKLTVAQAAMLLRMASRVTRDEFTPTGNRTAALSAANWYRSNDVLIRLGLARAVSAGGARRSVLTDEGVACRSRPACGAGLAVMTATEGQLLYLEHSAETPDHIRMALRNRKVGSVATRERAAARVNEHVRQLATAGTPCPECTTP